MSQIKPKTGNVSSSKRKFHNITNTCSNTVYPVFNVHNPFDKQRVYGMQLRNFHFGKKGNPFVLYSRLLQIRDLRYGLLSNRFIDQILNKNHSADSSKV